jgi:ligand-binding sensor domain-containing protein
MKNLKLKICFSFFILSWGFSKAQTFTNYTTSNGLPDNYISGGVAIDTNNNKWFGTASGVAKFNDTVWTIYTTANGLIDNNTNCIAVDKNNNIWVGTNNGVSKFNGNTWTSYNTSNGLVDNTVYYIACDIDGSIWFATYSGASKLNGTTWTTYNTSSGLPTNAINFITVDASGNKWFGTQMGGLVKYNNSVFRTFTASSPDSLLDNNVFAVACDLNDKKWVGTWYGMSLYNSTDNWVANYRNYNGLFNNFIRDIDADTKGNIWIGMFADYNQEGGISWFDGSNWTSYTVSDGLVNAQVIRMAVDKQDNLWIATGEGVSKLTIYAGIENYTNNNSFTVYPNPASDIININTIYNFKEHTIELYNNLGQKVYQNNLEAGQNSIQIPLNNISNGVYIVKYNNTSKKILVNK